MEKSLSFITLSLVVLLFVFSFVPKSVLADGMMIKPDPYSDRWDYSNESNQQAFINYNNGLQKMIISVGLEGENSNGVVWLFPVPSNPNKVAIDVVKNLPQLSGEEISKKAKSNLDDTTKFLQMTQFYTIPFVLLSSRILGTAGTQEYDALGAIEGVGRGVEPDVVVYEHLEKEGITSEIITAKTAFGLYDYLKNKGLKIESGSIPVLDNYIGKEYSFVASWISEKTSSSLSLSEIEQNLLYYLKNHNKISNVGIYFDMQIGIHFPKLGDYLNISAEKAYKYLQETPDVKEKFVEHLFQNPVLIIPSEQSKEKQRGIFVTFPTKDIYFPMLPTSVYGSKTVPATIRVIGYVSPKVFQDIKSYTKTDYYIYSHASFADDLKSFYNGQNRNIKYTKIEINAPAKFLTEDLWISNFSPIKTYYSTFIAKHPVVSAILLLIISSLITGILAGLIAFRMLRKNILKLGLVGLSNCLSIFGLLITTMLVGTKEKNESVEPIITEIKQKGYFWRRKLATILLLADLPFLVISVFAIPSLIEKLTDLFDTGYFYAMKQLIVVLASVAVLVFSLIIRKIKPEDKNLFKQLKLNNYSSWSLQPRDKMKIAFVPVFSVAFLVISWLLVKLVGLTV